jgi:hypothetical protein
MTYSFSKFIWAVDKEERNIMAGKRKLKTEHGKIRTNIPIVVDDVKTSRAFPMSRCTYFSVECHTLSPRWALEMRNLGIPLLMIELSGVVCEPMGAKGIFVSKQKIEDLFETVEKDPGVYIDTNDLWLPNSVFDLKTYLKPNSVYSVGFELFEVAYGFRKQPVSTKQYVEKCRKRRWKARYSARKTQALKAWHEMQIEEARAHYKEHPESSLRVRYSGKGE